MNEEEMYERRKKVMGRLFVRAAKTFQTVATDRIREEGFDDYRFGDNAVLVHLESGGNRISTIAQRSGLTKQAVSQLVNDMEKRGIVVKEKDPSDGRAQIVKFTDHGSALLETGVSIVEEIDDEIAELIGERRSATLRKALIEFLDVYDPEGF